MISVNLIPAEELENKLWFIPELIFALMIGFGGTTLVNFVLENLEMEIAQIKDETQIFDKKRDQLKPALQRYEEVTYQISLIQEKIASLQRITLSKITRYKPIVILEQLQNLRPEGVWFVNLTDDTKNSLINLTGGAFDNLLVADFMTMLEEPKRQELDPNDVRTHIYFKEIKLDSLNTGSVHKNAEKKSDNKNDLAQKAFESTADKSLAGETKSLETSKVFSEISDFPKFSLKLKYEERFDIAKINVGPSALDKGSEEKTKRQQ